MPLYIVYRCAGKERKKMKKNTVDKYWEKEEGELVEFGKCFMRCFDEAGKIQFGNFVESKTDGSKKYFVKFTLDKKDLLDSDEGAEFLIQTIEDWWHESDED